MSSTQGSVFFILWGAVLVFSMHGGFAFLEAGSVRRKNVVDSLTRIITDWSISTVMYFAIGWPLAYGAWMYSSATGLLSSNQGFNLVHFFFLLTFAACAPAIISGGIAERVRSIPVMLSTALIVALIYPFYEAMVWGQLGWLGSATGWLAHLSGAAFHDYAGSVVVHAMGGWLALPAIWIIGPRVDRMVNGVRKEFHIHSIPLLALGSWLLVVGWFGFNVASAGSITTISGLVALNSLMAMVGGIIAMIVISRGKNEPIGIHNGALAGLVAICSGSDVVQPISAFVIGVVAGLIFYFGVKLEERMPNTDDVLGVWPLHGLNGSWGGIATGIFGLSALGGLGGVNLFSQLVGVVVNIIVALVGGYLVFKGIDIVSRFRLSPQEQLAGADLSVHGTSAYPEEDEVASEEGLDVGSTPVSTAS
jgi:ammonium transporter, Amt family